MAAVATFLLLRLLTPLPQPIQSLDLWLLDQFGLHHHSLFLRPCRTKINVSENENAYIVVAVKLPLHILVENI